MLPQVTKVGSDAFFEMHPEFKNVYPCCDDRTERACRSIDRLSDRLWSLGIILSRLIIVEPTKDVEQADNPVCVKEWVTYEELIKLYDFRGVKSAKDASWRKRNGFDKCVSQSGGKGSAVKYSVTKINEWLANGKGSKRGVSK